MTELEELRIQLENERAAHFTCVEMRNEAEAERDRLRAALEPFVRGLRMYESGACITENLPLPRDDEPAKNVYVGDQRVATRAYEQSAPGKGQ